MLLKHEMTDWQVVLDGDLKKKKRGGNFELKLSGDAKWKETGVSRVESTCHLQLSVGLINIKF